MTNPHQVVLPPLSLDKCHLLTHTSSKIVTQKSPSQTKFFDVDPTTFSHCLHTRPFQKQLPRSDTRLDPTVQAPHTGLPGCTNHFRRDPMEKSTT